MQIQSDGTSMHTPSVELGGAARRCQLTAVVVWCRGGRLDVAAVDVPGGDVRGGGIGGTGADFGAGAQWGRGWGSMCSVFKCAVCQTKDSIIASRSQSF